MSKLMFVSLLAGGMLISNLLLMGFMIFGRPRADLQEETAKTLHFDEKQKAEHAVLVQAHKDGIRDAEHELLALRQRLYTTLRSDSSHVAKDSLLLAINKIEFRIENIHYTHFENVGKLCRADQKTYFIDFASDLAERLTPKKQKK
jgi:hypothetical protein